TAAKSHSPSTDATVSYEFIAEKIIRSRAAAGMSFLPADDDPDSPRWTTLSLADPRLSSPQEQQPSIKSVAARDNVWCLLNSTKNADFSVNRVIVNCCTSVARLCAPDGC